MLHLGDYCCKDTIGRLRGEGSGTLVWWGIERLHYRLVRKDYDERVEAPGPDRRLTRCRLWIYEVANVRSDTLRLQWIGGDSLERFYIEEVRAA